MQFPYLQIPRLGKSRAAIVRLLLWLLLCGIWGAADARAERMYPVDNDAEYESIPQLNEDNDRAQPYVLKKGRPQQQPQPYPPAQSGGNSYPADNDADYEAGRYPESDPEQQQRDQLPPVPTDNDNDYKAPRPKGSDGDKNFYPLYYY